MQQQFCTYINHENQTITQICIDQQCSKNKRLCYQCLYEKIHDHQQSIVSITKFKEYIQQKAIEFKKIQHNLFESSKQITSIIENIQRTINQQQQQIRIQLEQTLDQLETIADELSSHLYTDETINQGLNVLNNKQIDTNRVQEHWIELKQELQNIDNKYNQQSIHIKSRPINIKIGPENRIKIINNNNINHQKYIIKHENAEWIQAISISPCEKYLISSGCDQKLIIWDLQSQQIFQTIQHSEIISSHCFSSCSKIVYLGDKQGKIHNKPLNWNNQSHILKTFEISHNSKIEFLLIMPVNLLSASEECIKISMINPNQLLQMIRLEIQLDSYEYSQQENFIVLADIKNIMIWNARDDYKQLLKHQISISSSSVKIQLLNQDSQLAAASDKTITIYWIDFESRSLTEYTRIKSNEEIINLIGQNFNSLIYITYNEIIQVGLSSMKNYNIKTKIKEDTYNSPNIRFNKNSNYIITVNGINIVIYKNFN